MAGGELKNNVSSVEPDAVLLPSAHDKKLSRPSLPTLDVIEKFEVSLNKKISKAQQELDDTNQELLDQREVPLEKLDTQLVGDLEAYRDELLSELADLEPQSKLVNSAKAILSALKLLRNRADIIASDMNAVDKELTASEDDISKNPTMKDALTLHKEALEETRATLERQMKMLTTQIKAKEQSPDLVAVQELMDPQRKVTKKKPQTTEQAFQIESSLHIELPPVAPPTGKRSDSSEVDQMIAALNAYQSTQPESQQSESNEANAESSKKVSLVERPKPTLSESEEEAKNIYKLSSEKRGAR